MNNITEFYYKQFEQWQSALPGCERIQALRMAAIQDFSANFPTRKTENWKYFSLNQLHAQSINSATTEPVLGQDTDAYTIEFVNGKLRTTVDAPFKIHTLAEVLASTPEWLQIFLSYHHDALYALNRAFMHAGLVIHIPANTELDKPIRIRHEVNQAQFTPINHFILLEDNARAVLVEEYHGDCGEYFVNTATHCQLQASSHLEHIKIINEHANSHHIGATFVRQNQQSHYRAFSFCLNGGKLRNDYYCQLQQEHSCAELFGTVLANHTEVMDNHTAIEHLAANTQSREYYKGIASDKARIVFNGKIRVVENAQQIRSEQQNKNLLLSNSAEIDSKPELEIFADDVKCSHGAAIGELDKDALFYLQSRGVNYEQAKAMLLQAFIDEILDKLEIKHLQVLLRDYHYNKLMNMEISNGQA